MEEAGRNVNSPVPLFDHLVFAVHLNVSIFDIGVMLDESHVPNSNSLTRVVVFQLDSAMLIKSAPNRFDSSLQSNNIGSRNPLMARL